LSWAWQPTGDAGKLVPHGGTDGGRSILAKPATRAVGRRCLGPYGVAGMRFER
jgi:hypothetical protein